MADFLFENNVSTTLNGAILSTDTTGITLTDASRVPTPVSGRTVRLTFIRASDNAIEIVDVTAKSGNDIDITRARESTTALNFADGDTVEMRITKGMLDNFQKQEVLIIPLSAETGDLAAGTGVTRFVLPYAFILEDVALSVSTAPTGAAIQVDVNEDGTSLLSTVASIDADEKTSNTAATPEVISDDAIAAYAELSFDIDQVGSTVPGEGLKVMLIGRRA